MDKTMRMWERQAACGDATAGQRLRREMVRQGMNPVADFASRLIERERMEDGSFSHRVFWPALFENGVKLSIQAGSCQYCSPRQVLPRGDHSYTEWELGGIPSQLGEPSRLVEWEADFGAWYAEGENRPDDRWLAVIGEELPDPVRPLCDTFTVAGYTPTETVQEMLDQLFILHGTPTWGPEGETVNPHADNVVEFSENNSGGSWWLSQSDYAALEEAGWEMGRRSYDGSIRGATRRGLSDDAAIEEWARITGENPDATGCECCGEPFHFF